MKTYPPLRIGPLQIELPVILAPMAGYTNRPFREICSHFGCELAYTELTVAEGIARRLPPTLFYLNTSSSEGFTGAHLYAAQPDSIARAASVVEKTGRFSLLDINAGCPVRKLTSKGAGAALMRSPETLYAMIRAAKSATSLPITVKTRIGRSSHTGEMLDVAHATHDAGADAITVHARYACDRHKGPAHWDQLALLKQTLRLPIIGNGGVHTPELALRMLDETGVDGVMIGRAALGHPWLFAAIRATLRGETWNEPTSEEKIDWILEHARRFAELMNDYPRKVTARLSPEEHACRLFRPHLACYLHAIPGARCLLREYNQINTLADLERILETFRAAARQSEVKERSEVSS